MTRATVITDASHCPHYDVGGFGAYVRIDGISDALKFSGPLKGPIGSSTFAEVRAALIGIWYAYRNGGTHILLQTDCMTLIHLRREQCKSASLVELWRSAFDRPDMPDLSTVSARHVKGHGVIKDARTWVNAWCDDVAKQHMKKERGKARAYSKTKAKYRELTACPPVKM